MPTVFREYPEVPVNVEPDVPHWVNLALKEVDRDVQDVVDRFAGADRENMIKLREEVAASAVSVRDYADTTAAAAGEGAKIHANNKAASAEANARAYADIVGTVTLAAARYDKGTLGGGADLGVLGKDGTYWAPTSSVVSSAIGKPPGVPNNPFAITVKTLSAASGMTYQHFLQWSATGPKQWERVSLNNVFQEWRDPQAALTERVVSVEARAAALEKTAADQAPKIAAATLNLNTLQLAFYAAKEELARSSAAITALTDSGLDTAAAGTVTAGRVSALEAAAGFEHPPLHLEDSLTAAAIALEAGDTDAALRNRAARLGELVIGARAYGVSGTGGDDTEAFHAAAAAAAAFGAPLILDANAVIGISGWKKLPAGLTIHTNGARFRMLVPMGRNSLISLASNTRVVGGLHVETLGGDSCAGVSIAQAQNVTIDRVTVRSAVPGAGKTNIRDNALHVNESADITLGSLTVTNYDWPLYVNDTANFRLGWMEADTYSKAVHLEDVPRLRIGGGWVHGTSPNASYLPGYNGILMEATTGTDDVRIDNFTVEDATEHGFRISGPAQQTNIWLSNCMARNVGGTGFKVLGGTLAAGIYNENITFDNCTVEDAGKINQNTCGFLVQLCNYVRIVNPVVRRRNKPNSAVEGIRLAGVKHVLITDPLILDPISYGIRLEESLGNIEDVRVRGARIRVAAGHAVYLQNSGVNFKDIDIEASVDSFDAGSAFYIGRFTGPDTGTLTGFNRISLRVPGTAKGAVINPNSSAAGLAAFQATLEAPKAGTWVFKPGSEWLDTSTGVKHLQRAGAWAAL